MIVSSVPPDVAARALFDPSCPPLSGEMRSISQNARGEEADQTCEHVRLSADGRYAAFTSGAHNLVIDDHNNKKDVFVRDNWTGQVTRVSVASDGSESNGDSFDPSISSDGRLVVFSSKASNLGDPNEQGCIRIYVHDCQTGETKPVSRPQDAQHTQCQQGVISADGKRVAFRACEGNFWQSDGDIFVSDLASGTTVQVNIGPKGERLNSFARDPVLSGDGQVVAFTAGDAQAARRDYTAIHVMDLRNGKIECVSRPNGTMDSSSYSPSLSADGSVVAFFRGNRIVAMDRKSGHESMVADETNSYFPRLSADGRFVTYVSDSQKLAGQQGVLGTRRIYVHDLQKHQNSLLVSGPQGAQLSQGDEPDISADGMYIAFQNGCHVLSGPGDDRGMVLKMGRNPLNDQVQDEAIAREAQRRIDEVAKAQPAPPRVVVEPGAVIIDGVRVPRRSR
jgi:Tol biopolymer transport system component